jgi:glucosamine--fructose-6-phosphate aminotransferase (isomerizing)
MCGITAYLGSESAFKYILSSLILLQNRGYDSAGICSIDSKYEFTSHKYASTDRKTAIQILENYKDLHSNNTIGIGHTRWATHGAKTDTNAHPHFDTDNQISVVHNGIIENYLEIKSRLIKEGINFVSQTDTEVIPKLLEYYLRLEIVRTNKDYNDIDFQNNVLKKAISELQGTWAIVILFKHTPNKLYLCKNGSPLVLGIDNHFALISSEQLSLSRYFNHYITLNDGDILTITKNSDGVIQFPNKINYIQNIIQNRVSETSSYPYPHWTIKEICEQPMSIMRTLNMGGRILGDNRVKLGGLDSQEAQLLDIEHLVILGCGTSYNAGQIGCSLMRTFKCFTTVTCIDASEFTIDDIPNSGKTGFVMLSQSGETKDLHRCMETIRNLDCPIMSIVNVVGSLIARESDCGIYLNAGREVGVASTKSFTSQVVALTLMAIWFSQHKNTCAHLRQQYVKNLRNLSLDVERLLGYSMESIRLLATKLTDVKQMFILGRGTMKFIADEGSLKIKEIAYIHTEGYAGGSLKHGPFALIDSDTVIILIAPKDENFSKMINAAEEVHSRNARIILITNTNSSELKPGLFESVISIPSNESFTGVLSIIPLQILAYEIALLKGHNPDFPKNLAKVVTVDG